MPSRKSALAKRHAEQAEQQAHEPGNENDSTTSAKASDEVHGEVKAKPDMKALVETWATKRAKVETLKRELKMAQDDLSTAVMQLDSGGLTKFRYKGEQHIIMHRGDSWFTKGESKTEVVDFD